MTRPKNLIYAANDRVPFFQLLGLALQFAATAATFLILPIIIIKQAKISPALAASFISIAMLMIAISTILQAIRSRFIGSGFLVPSTCNPAYFAPSLLAVKIGGLALLAGMTIVASIAEAFFSFVLRHMRRFFPQELGALVITMIGFELGAMGLKQLFVINTSLPSSETYSTQVLMGLVPLLLMFVLHIFGKGKLKLFSLLISMMVGYLVVIIFGFFDTENAKEIHQASWFFTPHLVFQQYAFNKSLMIPFLITALVCAIKVTGSLTALQQMQDTEWKQPDMKNISRGIYADATTSLLAGLLGNMGVNTSSSCMALSISTGISSRFIAYPFAAIFFLLAFCPKITLIFLYMPTPVIGATLTYLGTALLFSSFESLQPLMTTPQRKYIIGISFMLGLSYDVYPTLYHQLPSTLQAFTGSSIAIATLCALFLNFILMLRFKKTQS